MSSLWTVRDKQRDAHVVLDPFEYPGQRGRAGTSTPYKMKVASASHADRFNPVRDRLDEGTVIEDWIPRDPTQINMMMRLIYIRDEIAGPTVDLFAELPWSETILSGVDDPKIRQLYEDWIGAMDLMRMMPELTVEYLVIGRAVATLNYNESLGYWDSAIVQDPNYVKIDPIPVHGVDPKLDLKQDQHMMRFIQSTDPRDVAARKRLSPKLIQQLRAGGNIPLDPLNTVFLPRRAGANDHIGTSFFTRLLTWWALQKPLINASAIGARRKAGGTTHVQVGKEGVWEPTPQEMQDIMGMFLQAEEDPVGSIVVTRFGVDAQRLDSNQMIWKLSDDYSFIAEGKMKALGINDAFLSGDANFTTMETALSVLLERIKTLRSYLTYMFLTRKAQVLARVHGFRRKKSVRHAGANTPAVRIAIQETEAMNIPVNELIVPTFEWTKKLQPVADENYLQILDMMEQKGLPITKRMYAAAAGISLKEVLQGLDDDKELSKKFNDHRKAVAPAEEDAMGGMFASVRVANIGSTERLGVWGSSGDLLGLRKRDADDFIRYLGENPKYTSTKASLKKAVRSRFGSDVKKRLAMRYVLTRVGLDDLRNIKPQYARMLVSDIMSNASDHKEAMREVAFVSSMANSKRSKDRHENMRAWEQSVSQSIRARTGEASLSGDNMLSGYIEPEVANRAA